MMMFISKGKNYMFRLIATYKIHSRNRHPTKLSLTKAANDNDDEISTWTCGLCMLYVTLIARKLSKPDDGRYRPKHVVFYFQ